MQALVRAHSTYFFLPLDFCARALPAADFDALLVRPSRRVLEAAEAAFELVCFFGALRWDNALPAADLDFLPVEPDRIVFDALLAALFPVTFLFAMSFSISHSIQSWLRLLIVLFDHNRSRLIYIDTFIEFDLD